MQSLFIIIVTYNGEKYIEKTLKALINGQAAPSQIVLVDNKSEDGTVNLARNTVPGAIIIETGSNMGFGQANNMGIKLAIDKGATHIFLLNQDAYVQPDTIQKLWDAGKENAGYGIYAPVQLNGSGTSIDTGFLNYLTPQYGCSWVNDTYTSNYKQVYTTSFANAGAWFMPVETIKQIGGFDPLFYHYGEDEDFVNRLHWHKLKMCIVPGSVVWHDREDAPKRNFSGKINFVRAQRKGLLQLKNLHFGLQSNLIRYFIAENANLLQYLVSGRFSEFRFHFRVFLSCLGKTGKIRSSRKTATSKLSAYL